MIRTAFASLGGTSIQPTSLGDQSSSLLCRMRAITTGLQGGF